MTMTKLHSTRRSARHLTRHSASPLNQSHRCHAPLLPPSQHLPSLPLLRSMKTCTMSPSRRTINTKESPRQQTLPRFLYRLRSSQIFTITTLGLPSFRTLKSHAPSSPQRTSSHPCSLSTMFISRGRSTIFLACPMVVLPPVSCH